MFLFAPLAKAQRGATKADPHKEDLAGTSFAVGRFYRVVHLVGRGQPFVDLEIRVAL